MSSTRGDTQARILAFIESYAFQNGYPPSVREICEATGLKSTSTVHGHLIRMEKKGLLNRNSMKPRAISLPNMRKEMTIDPEIDTDTVPVPVLGNVAAGIPILAEQEISDYIPLPKSMLGSGDHYILGVRGDSMIEAGIMHGDYIVVRQQNRAYNGDIVVAMIDDEATVKRFYMENGHFRLQPENSTMEPIIVDKVDILGKVVSLYRVF